ncbi:MAG: InlB B-repeat-containing protein [Christensenellaceae bacterium]|jgi:hypothetical protein|nr:InlB B-repeat-containing protein [Christensenellaceae bacterium]
MLIASKYKLIRLLPIVFVLLIIAITATSCASTALVDTDTQTSTGDQDVTSEGQTTNLEDSQTNVYEGSSDNFSSSASGVVADPNHAEGDLYTLSYVVSGGTTKQPERYSTVNASPQAIRATEIVTVDGKSYQFRYVLDGWYFDSALSNVVRFPYTLTNNTTFYAKWAIAIESVAELKSISVRMDANYRITSDINLSGVEWIPLGLKLNPPDEKGRENTVVIPAEGGLVPFTGTLNAAVRDVYGNDSSNNHKLLNLNIMPVAEEQNYHYMPYGLFAVIGKSEADTTKVGTVKNLDILSARIFLDGAFSRFYIGGLAGKLDGGNILNCSVNAVINNPELIYEGSILDDFLGSTFGYATPTIHTFIGGLVGGIATGNVEDCVTTGVITSASIDEGVFVGGLAGFNWSGTIRDSFSTVNVYGKYAGGLTGYNNGIIFDSYATGEVTGSMSYAALAGGLSAYNDISGEISKCYATGNVTARTAGGLVAVNIFNYSSVSPPNIAGDVIFEALKDNPGIDTTQTDSEFLAEEKAKAIGPGTGGSIKNCFAQGKVTGNEYAGGLIGRAESIIPILGVNGLKGQEYQKETYFIANNFAYGDVVIKAVEIAYKNSEGVYVITSGVFHSVFAGGLIGHASEVRMISCIAFGNVSAESRRRAGTGSTFNTAFVGNVVGQSSQVLYEDAVSNTVYYIGQIKNIFGYESQVVTKNAGQSLSPTSISLNLTVVYNDNNRLSEATINYLTNSTTAMVNPGLGFDTSIWSFEDVNFLLKLYPRYK